MEHITIKKLIDKLENIRATHGDDFKVCVLGTYTTDDEPYVDECNAEFEIEGVYTMFDDYAYLEIGNID